MRFARKTRPRWHTPIDSQRIPLASFTGGTQEIGGIHSERFCHGPESFEAGTRHRMIFLAPKAISTGTKSLWHAFLRKCSLPRLTPYPSSRTGTIAFFVCH